MSRRCAAPAAAAAASATGDGDGDGVRHTQRDLIDGRRARFLALSPADHGALCAASTVAMLSARSSVSHCVRTKRDKGRRKGERKTKPLTFLSLSSSPSLSLSLLRSLLPRLAVAGGDALAGLCHGKARRTIGALSPSDRKTGRLEASAAKRARARETEREREGGKESKALTADNRP